MESAMKRAVSLVAGSAMMAIFGGLSFPAAAAPVHYGQASAHRGSADSCVDWSWIDGNPLTLNFHNKCRDQRKIGVQWSNNQGIVPTDVVVLGNQDAHIQHSGGTPVEVYDD